MARVKVKRISKPWVCRSTRSGWVVWVPDKFKHLEVTADTVKTSIISIQSRGRERWCEIRWTGQAFALVDVATSACLSRVTRGRWADLHPRLIDALREAARWVVTASPSEACLHGDDPLSCPLCIRIRGAR